MNHESKAPGANENEPLISTLSIGDFESNSVFNNFGKGENFPLEKGTLAYVS